MPFQVQWFKKPFVIYFKLSGVVSEADFMGAVDQSIALAQEVPDVRIHTLIDADEIIKFPPLNIMGREIHRLLAESPNRGTSTVFGVSRMVRYVVAMLTKVTPVRLRFFERRQDALKFILQMVDSEKQLGNKRTELQLEKMLGELRLGHELGDDVGAGRGSL